MTTDQRQQLSQEMQLALDEAQQVLEKARRFHAENGLDSENARAFLESQMSQEDIAQVHAEVDAQMQEIARDARFSTNTSSGSALKHLRRHRSII